MKVYCVKYVMETVGDKCINTVKVSENDIAVVVICGVINSDKAICEGKMRGFLSDHDEKTYTVYVYLQTKKHLEEVIERLRKFADKCLQKDPQLSKQYDAYGEYLIESD